VLCYTYIANFFYSFIDHTNRVFQKPQNYTNFQRSEELKKKKILKYWYSFSCLYLLLLNTYGSANLAVFSYLNVLLHDGV